MDYSLFAILIEYTTILLMYSNFQMDFKSDLYRPMSP